MTYDSYEQSAAGGKPIELYDVLEPDGSHHRMNTSSETITYNSYDYEGDIVDREEVVLGDNDEVRAVKVKLKRSTALTNPFVSAPIEGLVQLTIYRQHEGFTVTFWKGYLIAVTFDSNGVPTCRFEPRSTFMPGVGQRRRNQRLCDHALYKTGCNVNETLYRVDGTISNVSGLEITSSAFGAKVDGWFVGGEIIVGIAHRLIKAHVGNVITISRLGDDFTIGATFRAYAGCDHLPTTCNTKFSNKLNFGGNEFLPIKNPFERNITL